jgi:hypothetical protein
VALYSMAILVIASLDGPSLVSKCEMKNNSTKMCSEILAFTTTVSHLKKFCNRRSVSLESYIVLNMFRLSKYRDCIMKCHECDLTLPISKNSQEYARFVSIRIRSMLELGDADGARKEMISYTRTCSTIYSDSDPYYDHCVILVEIYSRLNDRLMLLIVSSLPCSSLNSLAARLSNDNYRNCIEMIYFCTVAGIRLNANDNEAVRNLVTYTKVTAGDSSSVYAKAVISAVIMNYEYYDIDSQEVTYLENMLRLCDKSPIKNHESTSIMRRTETVLLAIYKKCNNINKIKEMEGRIARR